ncbi:hypothetical protein D6D05_02176 [Aureobasidium pullulans]|nr:hypothetical protein D6D05_02176 [Aureobasidium pullulans]
MAIGARGHPTGYDQPTQSSVSEQKVRKSQSPREDDFESRPKKLPTKSATKPPSKAAQSTAKDPGDPERSGKPKKATRKSRQKNNDRKPSDESDGQEKEKSKKKKKKPKKKSGQQDTPSDSDGEDAKWIVGQVNGVLVIKILTQSRSWGVSKKQSAKKECYQRSQDVGIPLTSF